MARSLLCNTSLQPSHSGNGEVLDESGFDFNRPSGSHGSALTWLWSAPVLLRQVAFQVAGVVQNSRDFNCSFIAAAVQQKVPRILYHSASSRPVAAESQVVSSGAAAQLWSFLRAGAFGIICDIAESLFQESAVTRGGAGAKSVLAPLQCLADVVPRRRSENDFQPGPGLKHDYARPGVGPRLPSPVGRCARRDLPSSGTPSLRRDQSGQTPL